MQKRQISHSQILSYMYLWYVSITNKVCPQQKSDKKLIAIPFGFEETPLPMIKTMTSFFFHSFDGQSKKSLT